MRGRPFFALSCIVIVGAVLGTGSGGAAAQFPRSSPSGCLALGAGAVTVRDGAYTVKPTDSACGAQGADIVAAQNEFESFQVVVKAPGGADLNGVQVSLAQCFEWCRANQTDADKAVSIYREAYANVFRRSDLESTPDPAASLASPNGAGVRWPDALIPSKDYFYGEARNAFPVDVPATENRAAWIDVLVPPNQAPGTYHATLSVTATGGASQTVPVTLTVLGFALPSTSSFKTMIGLGLNQLCPALGGCSTSADQWNLSALFSRLALENRLAWTYALPDYLSNATQLNNFRTYLKPYLVGTAPTRLAGARMGTILVYPWCVDDSGCLNGLAGIAANEDWSGHPPRFSVYCEELFKDASLWNACYSRWLAAKQAWKNAGATGLEVIAVADVEALQWAATHTNWQTAFADVTTLLPVIQFLNNGDGSETPNPFPGNIGAYSQFLAQAGTHRLWTYTSCESLGCASDDGTDPYDESPESFWRGWPVESIDQPATEERALPWLAFRWGSVEGEQYYEAAKRLPQAWNVCATPNRFQDHSTCLFSEGGNGDGTLLYPGTVARIGGTHAIPLESIRLKRMRDGREDYEWLKWLSGHGQDAFAKSEAAKLFPQAYCTDSPAPTVGPSETQLCTQIATVAQVRGELAQEIEQILAPTQTPDLSVTSTPMTASPSPAQVGDPLTYTITVDNPGQTDATGVTLTDTLPAGVSFVSAASTVGSCSGSNTSISCAVGSLNAGSSAVVTAVVVPTAPGVKTNAVAVAETGTDPVSGNNSASIQTSVTGLACTIVGTNGNDSALTGTAGNDVICGLGGNDTIHAGAANDTIYAGSGNDAIFGEDGTDRILGGPGDDTLDGGTGADTVDVSDALAGMGINLLGGNESFCQSGSTCGLGYDTFTDNTIENVAGTAYADAIVGDDQANAISAGSGADIVDAQAGNDSIDGGLGSDAINGGAGIDAATYATRTTAVNVTIDGVANDGASGEGDNVETDIENVVGGHAIDSLTGSTGPNTLAGGDGNDMLEGGDGNDSLNGGKGNDTVYGHNGTDTLHGNNGNDKLYGGANNDILAGDLGYDRLDGGTETDHCSLGGTGSDGGTKVACELS